MMIILCFSNNYSAMTLVCQRLINGHVDKEGEVTRTACGLSVYCSVDVFVQSTKG